MKKTILIFLLCLAPSILKVYASCWTIGSNSATCDSYYGGYSSHDYYIEPTQELYLYAFAIEDTAPGSYAYVTASWNSASSNPYYTYGTWSSNPQSTSDYLVLAGNLNLSAYTAGSNSSAGITASW